MPSERQQRRRWSDYIDDPERPWTARDHAVFEQGLEDELRSIRDSMDKIAGTVERLSVRLAWLFGVAAVIAFIATPIIAALASHYFGK